MRFQRPNWTFYMALVGLGVVVLTQATLISRVRVLGVSPDLLLVTVVGWSLLRGVGEGLLWGFAGGLGIDVISGLPLGMSALALLPAAWLGGLGRGTIYSSSAILSLLLVTVATPLRGWLILALQAASGLQVDWIATTLHVISVEAALNVLLMAAIYPVMRVWVMPLDKPTAGL